MQNKTQASFYPALLVAALTLLVFRQVVSFDFLSFDDYPFIFGNPYFAQGLSPETLKWIFRAALLEPSPHADYWQPFTYLSHLSDILVFGFNPAGHHLASLLWHVVNVLLVYALILRLTDDSETSLITAAVFAWHPVQVETVAWIVARKHLLSMFWMLCCMHFYLTACRRKSGAAYVAAVAAYALSLMSKANGIVLPLLLVWLDYWPLKRFEKENCLRVLAGKIPFVLLAGAAFFVPWLVISRSKGGFFFDNLPVLWSTLTSNFIHQTGKLFMPVNLGVIRSLTFNVSVRWVEMTAGSLFLVCLGLVCFFSRRRAPYITAGLLWFVTFMLPVSALRWPADRFLYPALPGFFLAFALAVKKACDAAGAVRLLRLSCWAAVLTLFLFTTMRQLTFWKDDIAFYRRGIEVSGDSYLFHNNLGNAYARRDNFSAALAEYEQALRLLDKDPLVYSNLGNVYMALGEYSRARDHYLLALDKNPSLEKIRKHLHQAEAYLQSEKNDAK